MYPAKGQLNVPTALGHMLMASAQRWADNQCCKCIPHVLTLRHHLAATVCRRHSVGEIISAAEQPPIDHFRTPINVGAF